MNSEELDFSCKTKGTERSRVLDVFKGAAIMGVVLAHMALADFGEDFNDQTIIGEYFYTALPMFMVVSGYFYKPGRRIIEYVRGRIVPIALLAVVGAAVLTLIMYCYLWMTGYDLTPYDIWGDIWEAIIGRGCFSELKDSEIVLGPYDVTFQFYYIQSLLVGYLIFYPLVDHVIKDWRLTLTAVLSLALISGLYVEYIGIQLPMYAQLGPIVASLLLVGAFLGKHQVIGKIEKMAWNRKFWGAFALTMAVAVVCVCLFPLRMGFCFSVFGDYGGWSSVPFVITTVSCGMSMMFIAVLVAKIPVVSGVLDYAGKCSMQIFVLHVLVGRIILSWFVPVSPDRWFPVDSPIKGVLLAFATITVIMVAILIKEKIAGRIKNDGDSDHSSSSSM